MKLPRKLKKKLKAILHESLAFPEVWKLKEIHIERFEYYIHHIRTPKLNYKGRTITAYKLTP